MKLNVFATALTLTAAVGAMSTVQAQDVEYRGSPQAAAICQAVVEDNPAALKTQLRKADRMNRNNRFVRTTDQHFACNGMSLSQFAAEQGSGKTIAYLEGQPTNTAVAQN